MLFLEITIETVIGCVDMGDFRPVTLMLSCWLLAGRVTDRVGFVNEQMMVPALHERTPLGSTGMLTMAVSSLVVVNGRDRENMYEVEE